MSEQDTTDATSEETITQVNDTDTEASSTEPEAVLGDAGKKALDAMKAERNAAKAEARQLKEQFEALQRELANKDKPAEEQAIENARAEARAEAQKAFNARLIRAELKAIATGKLADPDDAALFLQKDLKDFAVTDDGEVDSDALKQAIDALLLEKPHLAAQKQRRFDGDADQGAHGKTATPQQLTKADLARMTPEEIDAAEADGRLDRLLGRIK